jgi:hypothetical protein
MQLGGVNNHSQFSALMSTVGGDGQIWRSHRHGSAPSKGFGWEQEGGDEKIVHGDGGDRVPGLNNNFRCGMFGVI